MIYYYRCVTGKYDKIDGFRGYSGDRHILFTDIQAAAPSPWESQLLKSPERLTSGHDKNRFHKVFANRLFPDAKYSIYMDDEMDTSCSNGIKCATQEILELCNHKRHPAMNVTLIGLDLAKNVLQICAVNQAGNTVFNRAVKRDKLFEILAQYPGVPVAMEACSGSNHWGRQLQARGHDALLIPPQHVKPFVKGNKNDRNDAFAICEAARRPGLHFVQPRSLEQTDMLWAHRQRERLVGQRTQLINQLRGLLQEYGLVFPQGKERLRAKIPDLLEDAENGLTAMARHYLQQILEEWQSLDERIHVFDRDISQQCRNSEPASRLCGIRGVGKMTASAIVAFAGEAKQFNNARHFSANLGLVPKEHSSGGKQRLGGITKRGNAYVRRLLIQGAWSIIRYVGSAEDRLSRWARQLIERRGKQRAAVAIANKLARIIWAMLTRGETYQPA